MENKPKYLVPMLIISTVHFALTWFVIAILLNPGNRGGTANALVLLWGFLMTPAAILGIRGGHFAMTLSSSLIFGSVIWLPIWLVRVKRTSS